MTGLLPPTSESLTNNKDWVSQLQIVYILRNRKDFIGRQELPPLPLLHLAVSILFSPVWVALHSVMRRGIC
jgi:hypothetical protein